MRYLCNKVLNNFSKTFHFNQSRPFTIQSKMPNRRVQEAREKYVNMPLEGKRKYYKNHVELSQVPSWAQYFRDGNIQSSQQEATKAVDPELNDKVSLWQGDITKLEIDGIVNAANNSLLGGGGVDGAIHRAAGGRLFDECETLNGCPTGMAKITGGYRLPAKYVIHTVGPQGEHSEELRSCYENSLNLMVENGLRSIAFPCIATGIYGYPNENAANVALTVTRGFLEKNKDKVDRVIFTTFLPVDVNIYEKLLQVYFPVQTSSSQ